MLLSDPVLQELNRRSVAKSRMRPLPVMEDLDVFKGDSLDLSVRRMANPVYPLVLEAVEPALRRRVIPTIPLSTHRSGHAVFLELVLKRMAGVRAAPVGGVQQSWRRLLAKPGDGQRIRHDDRRHARLERPADDFPVEQVENDRQGQSAFIRPQGGDVRRPHLIRCRRGKVSGEQVFRHRQAMPRVRRDLVAPLVTGMKAVVAHRPFDPVVSGPLHLGSEFLNHELSVVHDMGERILGGVKRHHLI